MIAISRDMFEEFDFFCALLRVQSTLLVSDFLEASGHAGHRIPETRGGDTQRQMVFKRRTRKLMMKTILST